MAYVIAASFGGWLVWRTTDLRPSVFATQYGFGPIVESLLRAHEYVGPCPVANCDVVFHAHRMPLIPFFLAAIAFFNHSMLAAFVAKALVFSAFTVAAWLIVRPLVQPRFFWAGVAFTVLFPQLVGRMFDVHTEEGYLIHLQALIAALLLALAARGSLPRAGWTALIAATVAVFFTKSGQIAYAAAVCLAIWLLSHDRRRTALAAAALVAAGLLWAGATASRTGRFTLGTSWDAWNFYKGNNERTLPLYPTFHVDLLDKQPLPCPAGVDEWAWSDQYRGAALNWIAAHPADAIRGLIRRLGVAFVDVRQNGVLSFDLVRFHGLRVIGIIFMALFRVLFWVIVAMWARRKTATRVGPAFLLPAIAFLLPYLAGFVYERHLMPLVVPTVFAALAAFFPQTEKV